MSELTAKGKLDQQEGDPGVGYISKEDIQDAIGIIYDDIASWTQRGRNLLSNGAMQVCQRGTSVTSITTSGYYTADRWQTSVGTTGTWTQSVESDAPTGSGFRKSLKMLCTTADASLAASDYCVIQQAVEGQNLQSIKKGTADAQPLTLSFWVKSNKTGIYVVHVIDSDTPRHVSATYTVSASATWEQKTITFPADTTGVLNNDNEASLSVEFWLAAGSNFATGSLPNVWEAASGNTNRAVGQTNLASDVNNYWMLTGVQLETGSVQTPYDFKDYGQELRECQRYYYRMNAGAAFGLFGTAKAYSASQVNGYAPFPVPMRATPSSLDSSSSATFMVSTGPTEISSLTTGPLNDPNSTNTHFGSYYFTKTSAFTAGAFYSVQSAYNAAAYLGFSADL